MNSTFQDFIRGTCVTFENYYSISKKNDVNSNIKNILHTLKVGYSDI